MQAMQTLDWIIIALYFSILLGIAWCILLLGWVFVPFYMRSRVFTMPEFLEKRYSPTSRWILSIISLVAYILTKVSVTVYAGASRRGRPFSRSHEFSCGCFQLLFDTLYNGYL